MAVTYTNELVLQLVQSYKNHELLWDPSNPDFKNRTKKNDAWEDVANTVNIPRREVESKMHTLRSQFAREKKKIAQLRKKGNDLKYAPWFAYESLKFLLKGETETDGCDSSEMRNSHTDELSEPYHVENFQIAAPIPMLYESTDTTANLSTNSRKRTNSYDDKSDDPMGYGFAKQYRPSLKSVHDEFEIYGQYVASELRETKDLHSVLIAKRYINDILINARMGKYRKDFASNNSKSKGIKTEREHDSDVNDDE
ncbi:transcription factor Adf-1-like [Cydia pomonella]|uniref:transcription factor Adf-1-like n=1 Tax=Cydia pomonella TaxID=82600 RepID=UPI002ADD438A|nr:transcription factor Adf-1-like [Cydia pomonella]